MRHVVRPEKNSRLWQRRLSKASLLWLFVRVKTDARVLAERRGEPVPEDVGAETLLWLVECVRRGGAEVLSRCNQFDDDLFFADGRNRRVELSPMAWKNLSEADGKRILGLRRR
jgi:hypothetical protein